MEQGYTRFSIARALERLPAATRDLTRQRLDTLKAVMRSRVSLEVRDDSKLAWAYARNTLDSTWTAQFVADELALMHFLYNYTNFNQWKSTIQFEHVPNSIRYTGEFFQMFTNPMKRIEFMCTLFANGNFPTNRTWPWVASPKAPTASPEASGASQKTSPDNASTQKI